MKTLLEEYEDKFIKQILILLLILLILMVGIFIIKEIIFIIVLMLLTFVQLFKIIGAHNKYSDIVWASNEYGDW